VTNKNPVITSMNITPFGIQQLTTFQFSAVANDPDGDPVSYAWDVAGNAFSNASGSVVFSNGGSFTARLTVTDGKGGSVTDTRSFVCGSMTGRWNGTFSSWVYTSNLVQTGNLVSGDYSDQLGPGKLDPASANTIDANGNVKLRYKQSTFSDFTFTGVMDSTGRKITGAVNGSGYVNTPFTMTK
jgi:immune inhibitor A